MDWFDKMLDYLNLGKITDAFNAHKDWVLATGLRLVAVLMFILCVFFLYLAFYVFNN